MNYRIIIAWDGTEYQGWQLQGDKPTIQGAISAALERIASRPVVLHGASRTDSGVQCRRPGRFVPTFAGMGRKKLRECPQRQSARDIRVLGS